jgi:hypothetical protein
VSFHGDITDVKRYAQAFVDLVPPDGDARDGAARADYPIVDTSANKIINGYRTAILPPAVAGKGRGQRPPGEIEQRASARLNQDAGMRVEFFNKISAPTVTKVFERRPTKGRGVLPAGVEAKSTEHNDPYRYWR